LTTHDAHEKIDGMTHVSLKTARKINDVLGFVETSSMYFWSRKLSKRKCSGKHHPIEEHPEPFLLVPATEMKNPQNDPADLIAQKKIIPTFTFGELIRVIPEICMKRNMEPDDIKQCVEHVANEYANPVLDEKMAMQLVEDHINIEIL
jgi:hypothetical protein